MKKIITQNYLETQKIAGDLAKKILKQKNKAVVIGLFGDLGSGKTTFVQGFARALGIKGRVISPTFVIMKKFQIPKSKLQIKSKGQIPKFSYLFHIDAYRIKEPEEILALDWGEIISDQKNIVLVEWADRIEKILPKDCVKIFFNHLRGDKRKIEILSKFS